MSFPQPLIWRAGRDRLAHASKRGVTRTLCGLLPVPERLAWPATNTCPTCVERAEAARA